MAILIMVLGASITCVAANEPVSAQTAGMEVALDQSNSTAENDRATETTRKEVKKESWPLGAKIGVSVAVGSLISLIIVMGMIRGMNTAREATQADSYYSMDNVRIAVKSDRYTHSRKNVTKKQ